MDSAGRPTGTHPKATLPTDVLLRRRDAILAAVARTAERMSESAPWRDLLPDVLRVLGEATGVDRVYVFDVARRDRLEVFVSQRFEWTAHGIQPQIDNPELQEVPLHGGGFSRWGHLLESGLPVVGDLDDFPASERPLLESQSIRSLLVQPIFAGSRWWGFIGFDACRRVQSWADVEVNALRIASLVMGAAIQHEERESQFRQVQKMDALGRMAGGVAHDFNNVLMVVSGGIDLLRSDLERSGHLNDARGEHLQMVDQALRQATGLTRRLLDFSRRREGQAQVLSPLELVRHSAPLLAQAAGPTIRLEIAGSEPIGRVRIDPVQFEQIALNLVVNARDAMPRGGQILIAVETIDPETPLSMSDRVPPGFWTLVRVRDTGEGMPPEVRERVFEPFFTTKSIERGTGLGLSTVYGIVTGAGGHVAVSSEVGKGSEFRIYLPSVSDPTV
jgi:signal transduction histidine kinase